MLLLNSLLLAISAGKIYITPVITQKATKLGGPNHPPLPLSPPRQHLISQRKDGLINHCFFYCNTITSPSPHITNYTLYNSSYM